MTDIVIAKPKLPTIEPENDLSKVRAGLEVLMRERDGVVTATYEAQEDLKVFRQHEIANQDDLDLTMEITQDLKVEIKRFEALQKSVIEPLLAVTEMVRNIFRPGLTTMGQSEKLLKGKMVTALKMLQEKQIADLQAVSLLTQQGELGQAKSVILSMSTAAMPDKMSARTIPKFEIVDPLLVPDEYLMIVVNNSAIQAALDSGVRDIPGVKITLIDSVTVRKR